MIIYSVQILSYKYSCCQMQQSDGQICLFAKKKKWEEIFFLDPKTKWHNYI